ncbi:MAG TPA: HD-GYP domain-containing protein [Methylophilus sp.]
MHNSAHIIHVNQLRVGLYVHLDVGWMDHPFTISNFKLNNDEQIEQIKQIGLTKLRYDPQRSDCKPLPPATPGKQSATQTKPDSEVADSEAASSELTSSEIAAAKLAEPPPAVDPKQLRLQQLHRAIDESEKHFVKACETVKQINRNILTTPKVCLEQAHAVVDDMVNTALMESDVAIHMLNSHHSSDVHYQHPLNVTVLSLMLAKTIEMSKEDARILGLSAMLHDIGKAEISDKVLMKKDPLTHSELSHYKQHTELGARMAKQIGLPPRFAHVLMQHHEHEDGSGYPLGLKAAQIDPFAKIILVANTYDNLCNPSNGHEAKSPYEALAYMFAHQRNKFDDCLLKRLIKSLGVYPPGSVVKLSNGEYATVISVNPNHPLKPYIKVHIAKEDDGKSTILDLRETSNLNITNSVKLSHLPAQVLKYMQPRKKMTYYLAPDLVPAQTLQNSTLENKVA